MGQLVTILSDTSNEPTALTTIAPEIVRKRLIIEGYFRADVDEESIRSYFARVASALGLRTYGPPIISRTDGQGKQHNEGHDGFVPLIDSGIYIGAWINPRFLSTIIYTCGEFNADRAVNFVREFFDLAESEAAIF